jgi:hypothetical protein
MSSVSVDHNTKTLLMLKLSREFEHNLQDVTVLNTITNGIRQTGLKTEEKHRALAGEGLDEVVARLQNGSEPHRGERELKFQVSYFKEVLFPKRSVTASMSIF